MLHLRVFGAASAMEEVASAYLGVAAGVGEVGKAAGALAVLGINVAMLQVGGTLTILAQRIFARRAAT